MLCKKCGAELSESSKFCGYCGSSVENFNSDINSTNENIQNNLEAAQTSENGTVEINTHVNSNVDSNNAILVEPKEIQNVQNIQTQNNGVYDNKGKRKNKSAIIILLFILITVIIGILLLFYFNEQKDSNNKESDTNNNVESDININIESDIKKSQYWISGNSLESFDLYFLQLENEIKNKIYSPLSIKYALGMLEEGTEGESKEQISNVIGNYDIKKYTNSENMSFANAMFIKDTYKNSISNSYTDMLASKYNAEVKTDSFATPNIVNSWISDKTLGLINNLFDDISQNDFMLVNALAIDMEWKEKFLLYPGFGIEEKYAHENFYWSAAENVVPHDFQDSTEKVSGMEIVASFNRYDIVNTLGEANIRQTVKDAYIEYLKEFPNEVYGYGLVIDEDTTGLSGDEIMEKYLDKYIQEININYKKEQKTTDFTFYIDDNVKAFAKDLKEYDGTTLQYIGIMPTNNNLDNYIKAVTVSDINNIIGNLKELKAENFKDGVVTKVTGFIPKFKFDYELNLKEDLKKLGVTNIFELGKANLKGISSDESLYINDASHKANIEFTQDGIKASAVTIVGGKGAAGPFDYWFDVPVEEIDLTFDKPYMFIIRDKNSGEVWFMGTVYNPLLHSEDTTKGY